MRFLLKRGDGGVLLGRRQTIRGKSFDHHPISADAVRFYSRFGGVHHRARPADEDSVDMPVADQEFKRLGRLGLIHTSVEQLYFAFFIVEEVVELEPRQIAILEAREFFEEHDRVAGAVAIEQHELAVRLDGKAGFQQREDRRNARPPRQKHIAALAAFLECPGEAAVRRHGVDHVTGFDLAVRPGREAPLGHFLHGDAQFAFMGRDTDGIIAADFFPTDVDLQRQMLTGTKLEFLFQLFGHLEKNRHGVGRLPADIGNLELVESNGHRNLSDT